MFLTLLKSFHASVVHWLFSVFIEGIFFFKHCSGNDESIWLNPSHLVEQPLNGYSQLDGIGKNSLGN